MSRFFLSFVVIALVVISCGPEKNEDFCDCLKVTEKLNDQSAKILDGDRSEKSVQEQIRLRKKKDSVCDAFKEMDGPAMQELKKACEH